VLQMRRVGQGERMMGPVYILFTHGAGDSARMVS
jgi:hypothetical protein